MRRTHPESELRKVSRVTALPVFAWKQKLMETYDIIMLVVLVATTLFGAIKGFAWQVASIASFAVSYMVAYHFREPFSQSIHAEPPWNRFLAMLILFVGTSLAIWILFRMISGTIDRLKLNEFDRQIGAVFGFGKGLLYCAVITFFAVTLLGDSTRDKIVASKSGNYIAKILGRSESVIPPEIQEIVEPHLDKFDQRFNSEQPRQSLFPSFASEAGQLEGTLPDSFWNDSPARSNAGQLEPYPDSYRQPQLAPAPQQQNSYPAPGNYPQQQPSQWPPNQPQQMQSQPAQSRPPQLGDSTPWQPPFQR